MNFLSWYLILLNAFVVRLLLLFGELLFVFGKVLGVIRC